MIVKFFINIYGLSVSDLHILRYRKTEVTWPDKTENSVASFFYNQLLIYFASE